MHRELKDCELALNMHKLMVERRKSSLVLKIKKAVFSANGAEELPFLALS